MNAQINISKRQNIHDRIYTVRGVQVMLDNDLAEIYGVKTKVFNQAVKRNECRFPETFRFQLTKDESKVLRSQIVTLKYLTRGQHRKHMPYAFTEQGVAMLSSVLRSRTAIETSIKIIQSFVRMRQMITDNIFLFQRIDHLEQRQLITETKLGHVLRAIEDKTLKPQKGIFFEGQIFDAYVFASKLIKQAHKSILLIDNYIDESVLTLLSKRVKNCTAVIYTKSISKKLQLDLAKHNAQYSPIEIHVFQQAHDRFLILDNKEVYHIGASLKDMGKKWFAFSKFEKENILEIFERLKKQ